MRAQEHDPGIPRDFLHNVSLKVKEKVCIIPLSMGLIPAGMGPFAPSGPGFVGKRPPDPGGRPGL